MTPPELVTTAVEVSRLAALRATLALASKTPFYSSHWGSEWQSINCLEDLHILPFVDKATIADHGTQMLTSRVFPDQVAISGGTTWRAGQRVAFRYATCQEYDALSDLSAMVRSTSSVLPITLEIISQVHGATFGARPFCFRVPLFKPNHLAAVVQLMDVKHNYEFASSAVEVIVGSVQNLQVFAAAIARHSIDTSRWTLKGVISTSAFLDDGTREELTHVFNSRVWNCYGISEVTGSACLECASCGYFHLEPTVYGEFLPVSSQAGDYFELCLTSLLPFQVLQPLVRYRTDDLVELSGELCDIDRQIGFRPVGRVSQSRIRKCLTVLPSFLLEYLIGTISDVARKPYAPNSELGLGQSPSCPVFSIEPSNNESRWVLTVTPNDMALRDAVRQQAIRTRLMKLLHEQIPGIDTSTIDVIFPVD